MGSLWVSAKHSGMRNYGNPNRLEIRELHSPWHSHAGKFFKFPPAKWTVPAITQGAQLRAQKGLASPLSPDSSLTKLKNKPQKYCPKSQVKCPPKQSPTKTMSAFNRNLPDSISSRKGPQTRRNPSDRKTQN